MVNTSSSQGPPSEQILANFAFSYSSGFLFSEMRVSLSTSTSISPATHDGNKKSWWWNKLWKRRTITARDLKYLDGEDSHSENQTSNSAPEQIRGRRGAASFVTSRPTGPQTSKHLSLESLPHLRPLVCDQVEVAEASELFPFHNSVGVFVSRLHHRQQDHPESRSMY